MPAIIDKLLRIGEGKILRELEAIVKAVNAIEDDFVKMTDDELRGMTAEFRERLDGGETLDDVMPEAFATVREASKRVLGMRPFDVQIMGAAALHLGNIAEMKTGEGKTLVAVLPSYLNALAGKGVHVVTVNDYLAKFQSEQMGRVHHFLGLTVGVILPSMRPAERREAYACDITYGTNNELGFKLHPRLAQPHLRARDLGQERGRDPARVAEVEGDVVRAVVLDERARLAEHPPRRLAEGDRQQPPRLAHPLAGAQEERHAATSASCRSRRACAMKVSVWESGLTPLPSR